MKLTFHIWRQKKPRVARRMERYESSNMNPDMSMLERSSSERGLILGGKDPVVFEHDCREASAVVRIRDQRDRAWPAFRDYGLPVNASSFSKTARRCTGAVARPCVSSAEDLMVDRSPFDRIVAAGGYISVPGGKRARNGNAFCVPKEDAGRFYGRGRLHRLRRLRRGRVRTRRRRCSQAQRSRTLVCCRRVSRKEIR